MKTKITTYLLCSLRVATATSFSQPKDQGNRDRAFQANEAPQGPQAGAGNRGELLARLLEMDADQLAQLRQTIERVENMTPAEKERAQARVKRVQKLPPERVKAMRERYQSIPAEKRAQMRQRLNQMTPEEREAWREKMRATSPEKRRQMMQGPSAGSKRTGEGRRGPRKQIEE